MNVFLIFLLFVFSFYSCNEKINESMPPPSSLVDFPESTIKTTDTRFNQLPSDASVNYTTSGFSGISTNPSITIHNGKVDVSLKDGEFITGTGKKVLLVTNDQINGTLILKNAITDGAINGITIVTSANVVFTPDESLQPSIVYNLEFTENKTKLGYKEKIIISEANFCNPSNEYYGIPFQKVSSGSGEKVDLVIKDNVYNNTSLGHIAIAGWNHLSSKSFYFKINNRTNGAKYRIITAYGAYNIPGHECELYYQRDVNTPFPTWADNNYGSKVTKITEEDTAFHNPVTKEFYHFSKTYVVVKVFNASNVDITSTDTGVLSLQQTDSLYGLPLSFKTEEESSLLAYLNRGNNNSYSMVLGGLIVGIFAFFISRKLMKKDEEL